MRVEKLVFGGHGLAHAGGRALLVPFAAPGDLLRIRVGGIERGVRRGSIEAIVEPAPDRREPGCPHFGICGGCQLQHVRREAQLAAKVEFVRDALRRIAGIAWSAGIAIEGGPEYGWRSRTELHLEQGRVGYRRARSRELVAVDDCPILVEPLRAELRELASGKRRIPERATRVRLAASADGQVARAWDRGGERSPEAATFSQANPSLAEALTRTALGDVRGSVAVELYAGAGFFTAELARRFGTVHAVESDAAAVELGKERLRTEGIGNVAWSAAAAAEWLASHVDSVRPDFVLLDPPRAGAGPAAIRGIAALRPARIAYVSCDPATLARDLRLLVDAGYALRDLAVLDLFPQSTHVETVAGLTHGGG